MSQEILIFQTPQTSVDSGSTTATTSRDLDVTGSSTPTPSSTIDSPSGLSQGAKVGIGVSIPLVLLLFALVVFLFFQRRRRTTTPENPPTSDNLPELHAPKLFQALDLFLSQSCSRIILQNLGTISNLMTAR